MTTRVLTGNREEIAQQVVRIDGLVREAIGFIEERPEPQPINGDIFAEMELFTVRCSAVDDSRAAIYERGTGE